MAAVGQRARIIKDITDVQLNRMLWSGLPFVYDDPSDIKQLKTLLMNCFGGGIIGSSRMTSATRTVPVVCANDFIVQALAQEEERYVYTYNVPCTCKHIYTLPALITVNITPRMYVEAGTSNNTNMYNVRTL